MEERITEKEGAGHKAMLLQLQSFGTKQDSIDIW